jgi:hypothetical protein
MTRGSSGGEISRSVILLGPTYLPRFTSGPHYTRRSNYRVESRDRRRIAPAEESHAPNSQRYTLRMNARCPWASIAHSQTGFQPPAGRPRVTSRVSSAYSLPPSSPARFRSLRRAAEPPEAQRSRFNVGQHARRGSTCPLLLVPYRHDRAIIINTRKKE